MTPPDRQPLDTELEREIQSELRHSERHLASDTEWQLARARQIALAGQGCSSAIFTWPRLAVAASILAIVVVATPVFDGANTNPASGEQLLAQDDELYQNLEFYQWLVDTNAMDSHNG